MTRWRPSRTYVLWITLAYRCWRAAISVKGRANMSVFTKRLAGKSKDRAEMMKQSLLYAEEKTGQSKAVGERGKATRPKGGGSAPHDGWPAL